MNNKILFLTIIITLSACVPTAQSITRTETPEMGMTGFFRVSKHMEPFLEDGCRSVRKNVNKNYCDFSFKVNSNMSQKPNAFLPVGKGVRPVINVNTAMINKIKNDHEWALLIGHIAGRQIVPKADQKTRLAGLLLAGQIAETINADPKTASNLSHNLANAAENKIHSEAADRVSVHLAMRAGYDPITGTSIFNTIMGNKTTSSMQKAINERIKLIKHTTRQIKAAKAKGQRTPPITW